MNTSTDTLRFTLDAFEAARFANLCGQYDEHLRLIEQRLNITIRNRGEQFELLGPREQTRSAEQLIRRLYRETKHTDLTPDTVHLFLQESNMQELTSPMAAQPNTVSLRTRKGAIRARGENQQSYVKSILALLDKVDVKGISRWPVQLTLSSANWCSVFCWYAQLLRPVKN